ncbi:MAG: thioredoxin-like domain-containing protein [Bacteroidota bacterium]
MKTISSILLTCLFPFQISFAQAGYEIQLQVQGQEDGMAYLGYYFGDNTLLEDSTMMVDGRCVFKGEKTLDQGMYLVALPNQRGHFDLMVGEDQQFSLSTASTDLMGQMDVKGSTENMYFYTDLGFVSQMRQESVQLEQAMQEAAGDSTRIQELQAARAKLDEAVASFRKDLREKHEELFFTTFLNAIEEPQVPDAPEGADAYWQFYYYRTHFFDQLDLADDRLLRTPILHTKVMNYLDRLTPQVVDSIIAAVDYIIEKSASNPTTFRYFVSTLFNKYNESKQMGMESVVVHLGTKYYLSGRADWADEEYLTQLRRYLRRLDGNLIGDKGGNFAIEDLLGNMQSVYGIEADYLILYFWSYDCGTCKTMTPKLGKLLPPYLEKGVKLFTINTSGTLEEWEEKLLSYNLPGIHVSDPARKSGFDQVYDVPSTPTIYILDREKIIRYKHISVDQIPDILDYELGKKSDD